MREPLVLVVMACGMEEGYLMIFEADGRNSIKPYQDVYRRSVGPEACVHNARRAL